MNPACKFNAFNHHSQTGITHMQTSFWLAGATIAVLALGGCNKAQSPAEVQRDVAAAANSAAENNTQANEKKADVAVSVDKALGDAAQTADAKTADASADAALTKAEGNRMVATAKCESLAGDAQKACKDEADAAFAAAKAKASAIKANQT
jgi:hypothetical protein